MLFVTKGRFLKHRVRADREQLSCGRDVRVAGDFQLYFDPINVKFVADGMTDLQPAWASKPYFFSAKHIDTRDLDDPR